MKSANIRKARGERVRSTKFPKTHFMGESTISANSPSSRPFEGKAEVSMIPKIQEAVEEILHFLFEVGL